MCNEFHVRMSPKNILKKINAQSLDCSTEIYPGSLSVAVVILLKPKFQIEDDSKNSSTDEVVSILIRNVILSTSKSFEARYVCCQSRSLANYGTHFFGTQEGRCRC
jgi:hypothetical protein